MPYNQNNLYTRPAIQNNTPLVDTRLTVDSTAGGVQFAAAFFSQDAQQSYFTLVDLDVQTADVMCTFDGSAPTTTNGHRLYAGTAYTWNRDRAAAAKFIRATASDAAIHASPSAI